jgi:pimeloyl-ACP methyl ester carboxylesterase
MGPRTAIATILAVVFALLVGHARFQTPTGSDAAGSIAGDWVGGFKQDTNWTLIRAHFESERATLRGTLTIGNARSQGIELTDLSLQGSSLRFRLVAPPRDVQFEGTIADDSLSGSARGKPAVPNPLAAASEWTGPFHLTRVRSLDEKAQREYDGAYQWGPDAFVYLQSWNELTGTDQLVSFDESGDVRVLYPTDRDRFFAGPGAAFPIAVESRVAFQRDRAGTITSLTWHREGESPRVARRVETEKHEDVRISNGEIQLAGTLVNPNTAGRHPAIILVHGSGAQNRDSMLPFARFLVRRGMAILAYDKRGVGGSSGDWNTASFDDLASDVVAAFHFLKGRRDIDARQIGLLGISQGGWIMPLAAVRAKDIAFLINLSGAGVPASETTIDQARNEMTARGMPPQTVADIIDIMKRQYHFARTGEGWDEYAAARQKLAARIGPPPDAFPGTREDPYWQFIRRLYFYDPVPTLRQLQVPTLALFGELDNNILAEKNKAAWEAALKAGGNRDYTLRILPRANHIHLEAKVGSNAEMASLQRFVPDYFTTIQNWLAARVRLHAR